MSCETKLKNLVADNFFGYFKTHIYHLNVIGPDFNQYHTLLGEVYNYLYENHDGLSEQLRQMDEFVPGSIKGFVDSTVIDTVNKESKPMDMMKATLEMLEMILKTSQLLYVEAGQEAHGALETFIGDYMVGVSKLRWKIKSTLGV